jgi:hypothetical protein
MQMLRVRWHRGDSPWFLMFTAFLLVVGFIAFLWLSVIRDEVALDLHHASTTATVSEVTYGRTGTLRVTFEVDGRIIDTTIEQPTKRTHFAVGQRVAIDYDTGDPTRARLADNHDFVLALAFAVPIFATLLVIDHLRGRSRHKSRQKH